MTEPEIRQQLKNEALNKIRKMYSSNSTFRCDPYEHRSYGEQRGEDVRYIIETLERKLSERQKEVK